VTPTPQTDAAHAKGILAALPEGTVLVAVDDVARRLWAGPEIWAKYPEEAGRSWSEFPEDVRADFRGRARRLLGVAETT